MEKETIHLYTDGGCSRNPGPGGYGAVIVENGAERRLSGGVALTTNNRMELLAAIKGLEDIPEGSNVLLTSDSKYLVDAISKGWIAGWKRRGWTRSAGELQNVDLWKRLEALLEKRTVKTFWVKGHLGHRENEICDALAVAALKKPNLPPDAGYVGTPGTPLSVSPVPAGFSVPSSGAKITLPGQACRKCGHPVEKKKSKLHERKPGQFYFYEWYLSCPGCKTNYMVEAAKRFY
jgi:ribonuclease HI